ncbi:MAG: phage major capsid protein [Acidobacteriia bacterium]|nr:phage major capsid protein [Terriglobia bacterium]
MQNKLVALRQREATLRKGARAVLDAAERDGRDLTDAELANQTKTLKALDEIHRQVIAEEARITGEPEEAFIDDNMVAAVAAGASLGLTLPENPSAPRRKMHGRVGAKSWAEIFGAAPRSNGGFTSFEEYLRAIRYSGQGVFDPRLSMGHTEADPSQAGFMVPEQWAAFVLNYALENAICMSRCQIWPMSGEVLKVPGVRDEDHSAGSLFGGITEVWYDELDTIDEQNMETRLVQLSAHKLGMLANASSELVEDGPQFENVLTANLQAAAAFFTDRAFLFGSGVGRCQGMLDSGNNALIVVNKNANTPTGGFTFADACAMFGAMAPACRQRATWVFTDALIPALSQMQLVVTNKAGTENVGGSATPMFQMNADGTGTLLGRPALFTEKMKAAGQQGDAAFICFDQYAIGIRREMQLRRSLDAGFKEDSIWWRLTTRLDGQPTWENKLKLLNSNYVSPFVTLQART